MSNYPRTFSHFGISVPNVEKSVEFCSQVMGWYLVMKPTVITEESETPIGQMCAHMCAHMSTGDKIRVEMFEFTNQRETRRV